MTEIGPTADRPAMACLIHLGGEGLRLFFPLAAIHAIVWPLLWTVVYWLHPPSPATPVGVWHANEMIFGFCGAALIGFITTALPEWTDTKRPQGFPLFILAGLWMSGRLWGLTGASAVLPLSAMGDALWPVALAIYAGSVLWRSRMTGLAGFVLSLSALATINVCLRAALLIDRPELAGDLVRLAGMAMLALLGLALARITVPVTNLVLDAEGITAPFRPHPGRLNLAPGLVALAAVGEISGLSDGIRGYLLIAAGAAFLDRVGEAFIGREALRTEILALAGSSLFAGLGLVLAGASRLGAPFAETTMWHLAWMGGLGLGVLAVLAIAGLLHSGRTLGLSVQTRLAFLCAVAAVFLRVAPDLGLIPVPMATPYALPAVLWAAAFLLWLIAYWPLLSDYRRADKTC